MEANINISCLRRLLDEDGSRLISGETQLKTKLLEWINKDSSLAFKNLMHQYLDKVERHIQVLEGFCNEEQLNSISSVNRVVKALIEETDEKLANCTCPQVRDACLLSGIQSINHFKISAYGTAAAFAGATGLNTAEDWFYEAEQDERRIDESLSHLATHEINRKALAPVMLNK
ncbi:DUF892 family protein [Mucilaginibacter aquariorum]|uniref:DUF892 family protein n=1 Tax=Mucilaginibacter aquariorum TaxID=2967225 RepID=A0ABT1T299_9SPHI|nr:DUF892 family protein [Mucilaginibacter aquariorum]MCQ6958740.1 DUF892 family protein [Mucilaginibacter aquariorum]